MRIDKLLANVGFGTRKEVKKLLKTGVVHVDGEPVKDGKYHVKPDEQSVTVHGEPVEYKPYIYLMLNKPKGVISATEDNQHETVIDLLAFEHAVYEPFPVGRLDKDTEGFLILTNDGKLSHELMSPKKHVDKTYAATVRGEVTEEDVQKFKEGVELDDGYVTKPGHLVIREAGPISEIELTITEGKFHQVKRMFQAVGKKVLELKRISIGPLDLDSNLRLGEYREMTEEEIEILRNSK
ncbi:pseudouridine synthase [Alkalihalobacterium chitinilyticum]|uniref:Pseudouridine synthase n=1 Tax=Alkalihalobacterium chitinilyticum TaxID=2980103 RepID=A0ABT5VJN0_9BACI|nr:pseudouridine synthase [Alkalihalobacterium chitinilyticum]MDE5415661.1 rRNA pseudouridine synthase [Alkalihalobacterium chitinilyticum]